jgi:excisionase family DNA binding protein
MTTMNASLYAEVTSTLTKAGRADLAEQLAALFPMDTLTSSEAAALLGVSSANTVKNWLAGGFFPGAYQTRGGHWRFLRAEVEAVKARVGELRERNRRGDLAPTDVEDERTPPLL